MPAFSPALFRFLSELATHNDRAWFQAQKPRYEADARDPALAFVQSLVAPLSTLAPALQPDPRPVGGSLFRIYRDTRFAADKSPYKTHIGIHIRHRDTRDDVHAPGLYLHLEPGASMIGVGTWQPSSSTLQAVRTAILADPEGWASILRDPALSERFRAEGTRLKRPPVGVPADHPLVEELKRKDYVMMAPYTDEQVVADDFHGRFLADVQRVVPLMRWLTGAVGLSWA